MSKKIMWLFAVLLAVAFILIPIPASDLIIRISFVEIGGDACNLYYTTDTANDYSDEQCLRSEIDYEKNQVEFRLDGSLKNHLTGLRIDFPHVEQVICIKTITVSNAGVIQKEFNPCHFFAESNIVSAHEAEVSLVNPRNRAYISTSEKDPYLVLSAALTDQLQDCYRSKHLSRLLVCLFIAGSYFLAKKKLFH